MSITEELLLFQKIRENNCSNYHDNGKYMSESHPAAVDIPYLYIRIPEEFCYKSHSAISSEKPYSDLSWILDFLFSPDEYQE